jgi:aminoglycoside phosphotransferase (APT) family kinase protein
VTGTRDELLPGEVRAAAEDLGVDVTDAEQLTGGRAARTYRVGSSAGAAILRVESETGPTTGVALSPGEQYELLGSLAAHGVAAPRPIGTGHLPTGDYLMTTMIEGDVPSPWSRRGREVLGAEPLRSRLPVQCAEVLRAVHAVPVDSLRGVSGPAVVRPADELDRWRAVLESTAFGEDPLVRWCLHLVERDLPEAVPSALVHGDFRLGNLVVDGGSLVGVLDWELATVGDPALDLALLMAPPVAADWDRCGLDPLSTLVDHYLESRPDAAQVRSRLPALTLLATLKVVSLWVNGARASAGTVTAAAARCGLNALGARRYLVECLRPPYRGPTDRDDSPGPRARWRARVEQTLASAKSQGGWERAVLPDDLIAVPAGERAQGAALLFDTRRQAADLDLDLGELDDDPVRTVTALVRAYAAGRGGDDAAVEELVLRTVAPELEPRPW